MTDRSLVSESPPVQLDRSKPILIPRRVAVCPGCGARLYLNVDAWGEDDNGVTRCAEFTSQCSREPTALRGKRRDRWEEMHRIENQMPYVYWLPVDNAVEEWLTTVEIVDSEADRQKLATWNAWAAGA